VQVEEGRQVRLGSFLADLPSKTYGSWEELVEDIKSVWKE